MGEKVLIESGRGKISGKFLAGCFLCQIFEIEIVAKILAGRS